MDHLLCVLSLDLFIIELTLETFLFSDSDSLNNETNCTFFFQKEIEEQFLSTYL